MFRAQSILSFLPLGQHPLHAKWLDRKFTRNESILGVAFAALAAYGSYRFNNGHLVIGFSATALSYGLSKIRQGSSIGIPVLKKLENENNRKYSLKILCMVILSSYVGQAIRFSFIKQAPSRQLFVASLVKSLAHAYLHIAVFQGLYFLEPTLFGRFASSESLSTRKQDIKIKTQLAIFFTLTTFIAPRLSFLRGILSICMFANAIEGCFKGRYLHLEMFYLMKLSLLLSGAGFAGRVLRCIFGRNNTPVRSIFASIFLIPIHLLNGVSFFLFFLFYNNIVNHKSNFFSKSLKIAGNKSLFISIFKAILECSSSKKIQSTNAYIIFANGIFYRLKDKSKDEISSLFKDRLEELSRLREDYLLQLSLKEIDPTVAELFSIETFKSKIESNFKANWLQKTVELLIFSIFENLENEGSMTGEEIYEMFEKELRPCYKVFLDELEKTVSLDLPSQGAPVEVENLSDVMSYKRGQMRAKYQQVLKRRFNQLFPLGEKRVWKKKMALYFLLADPKLRGGVEAANVKKAKDNYRELSMWFDPESNIEGSEQGESNEQLLQAMKSALEVL